MLSGVLCPRPVAARPEHRASAGSAPLCPAPAARSTRATAGSPLQLRDVGDARAPLAPLRAVAKAAGEEEMVEFPALVAPGPYQQTLVAAFTLQGLGLHTAEGATVRVRPANAGDGRYFVRVPDGTNSELAERAAEREEEMKAERGLPTGPEVEAKRTKMFLRYLHAQDEDGYQGSFDNFLELTGHPNLMSEAYHPFLGDLMAEGAKDVLDKPEDALDAHIANVSDANELYTTLGSGEQRVLAAEGLLAALEACGVDNARIEIEGGHEVPVLDGSAARWAAEIQAVGVVPAPAVDPASGAEGVLLKIAAEVEDQISVDRDLAFVTLHPGPTYRVSAGVHAPEAPVIGMQWKSWDLLQDEPYPIDIAPARLYATSIEALQGWRDAGHIKGGTVGCSIVAMGDRWVEPSRVRFVAEGDEPARFEVQRALGVLAMCARPGSAGLPKGHVVAYRADTALLVEFARRLAAAGTDAEWGMFCDLDMLPEEAAEGESE